MQIKCKLCNHSFSLTSEEARKISGKHNGFIPCEKCNSHATSWNTSLLKKAK